MAGTIKLSGEELSLSENKPNDYIMSGYMGFVGEVATQYGGTPGKTAGLVIGLSSGIITGVFDKNMNPQKEYDNVLGTAIIGYGASFIGASRGAIIGVRFGTAFGPVGAVLGAVVAGLWGDDIYDNGEKLILALEDNLKDSFEYYDSTIYGKVTQKEFILNGDRNVMDAFPDYLNYRQITTISSEDETISYDSTLKEALLKTSTSKEKEFIKEIVDNTPAEKITINDRTLKVEDLTSIELRNAIDSIDKVSFLLSNITIYVGEKLDLGSHGIYTVKSGDTLSTIAQNLNDGTVTKDLVKLNPWLFDDNRIKFNYPDKVLIAEGTTITSNTNHTINGDSVDDYIKDANGGDDTIYGKGGDDIIYAGEGDDTIDGGSGADYLNGATGYDTYYTTNLDTIDDSDLSGKVIFDGIDLSGKKTKVDENTYEDSNFTYTANGSDMLIVNKNSGEYITVNILDSTEIDGDKGTKFMSKYVA